MAGSIPQGNRLNKIVSIKKAIFLSKEIHSEGKTIVIVGGCFDILHQGHIQFLDKAKREADFLFLLLESDDSVKARKGSQRPFNNQKTRAGVLSDLKMIDFIIPLRKVTKDVHYDRIISQIKPNVLATTEGDPNIRHKERQAKLIGTARVKSVIKRISGFSSTELASDGRR